MKKSIITSFLLAPLLLQSTVAFAAESMRSMEVMHMQEQLLYDTMEGNDRAVTRAEFVTMVVEHLYSRTAMDNCFGKIDPIPPTPFIYLFTDVRSDSPFAKQLCVALDQGLIEGYTDGSFRPDQLINMAEASKILSMIFGLGVKYGDSVWYRPYMTALDSAIFASLPAPYVYPTEGQLREIIGGLMQ